MRNTKVYSSLQSAVGENYLHYIQKLFLILSTLQIMFSLVFFEDNPTMTYAFAGTIIAITLKAVKELYLLKFLYNNSKYFTK